MNFSKVCLSNPLCRSWITLDAHSASLILLGDLLNRVAENDLFDWSGRSKLIDCISNFIVVRPHIGQTMIEKLLRMLQDPDYRVRFSLARRIGTLFQTWDGHDDLFQDICSNFGAKLVVSSKEKVVTAKEVLAAGPQPHPTMETIIITLMHLAMFSEKIELEAVFMMCVISAIDLSQRELVVAALDNLSRQLQYTSRSKYLEELMGSILFSWVACGVSLVSLVEVRLSELYYFCREERCRSSGVIDMIKIFRPDRVFMVMVLSLDYAD
ncbi:hypothetical protein RHGRI_024359 [Rhododendron griersonianum]|uniref:ARM repeat superfamily protein n=1 Tax=Rhododendron griersonianum TaxID=479676 RepID=A0AAV6JEC7_9ERIC|nr:hypothetical protein RHGRI_024359 [Rhododendron griersonianum]